MDKNREVSSGVETFKKGYPIGSSFRFLGVQCVVLAYEPEYNDDDRVGLTYAYEDKYGIIHQAFMNYMVLPGLVAYIDRNSG